MLLILNISAALSRCVTAEYMVPMQVALFIGNYASLEIMSDSLLTAILVWLSRCFDLIWSCLILLVRKALVICVRVCW